MIDLAIEEDRVQEQKLLESWIHRWGSSFSEILLEKPSHRFTLPHIEGFIGYYITSGCAVTFGDPVCSPEKAKELAAAFSQFIQEKNLNTIFILSSAPFSNWAINNICKVMIEIGEEIIIDPQSDPLKAKKGNKLRNLFNHGSENGLNVHEYTTEDSELEQAIIKVGEEWTRAKRGFRIYLAPLNLFDQRRGKRWFYLTDKDKIVGIALLSQLELYKGWLLKYLFTLKEAPKGSSEYFMVSILEQLRQENCHYLTNGTVPVERIGEICGLNGFKSGVIRLVYYLTNNLFHLQRKKMYWQKYHPKIQPTYLLASRSLGMKELYAIFKVLKVEI